MQSALTFRLRRDNVDNSGLAINDYVVVDWFLKRALTRALTATLRVENDLDRDYQQIRNFNTSGRLWYLGRGINIHTSNRHPEFGISRRTTQVK